MTHIITPTLTLDELRRQLRETEITYHDYKIALRTLPQPDEQLCDAAGCTRVAHSVQRGRALCAACAMRERNERR